MTKQCEEPARRILREQVFHHVVQTGRHHHVRKVQGGRRVDEPGRAAYAARSGQIDVDVGGGAGRGAGRDGSAAAASGVIEPSLDGQGGAVGITGAAYGEGRQRVLVVVRLSPPLVAGEGEAVAVGKDAFGDGCAAEWHVPEEGRFGGGRGVLVGYYKIGEVVEFVEVSEEYFLFVVTEEDWIGYSIAFEFLEIGVEKGG